MLAAASGVPVRNVAVDRGALKDDRNTNAEELYKEAEKLAKDLRTVLSLMSRTRTTPRSASRTAKRRNLKSHLQRAIGCLL